MRNHNVRLATNTSATHFLLLGTNIVSDVRDKPVAGIQWVDVFMAGSGDLRNVLVSAYQGLMYSYWDKTVSGKKDCNAVLSRCGAELDAAGNWPDRWCWQLKGNLRSRLYVRRLTAAASVASYLRILFFFVITALTIDCERGSGPMFPNPILPMPPPPLSPLNSWFPPT